MTKPINKHIPCMDDEEIIDLFFKRDEKAIETTDAKYGTFLFRISFHILNDAFDSEECKNDTYLATWNAIPPHRPTVFQAFIAQIIRRISINKYKEKKRLKNIPSEFTVSMDELTASLQSNDSIETTLEADELGKIISDYLSSLTKINRFIFMSRYYASETVQEIAKEIGLSESNVYKALGRLKKGLKNHLDRRGEML